MKVTLHLAALFTIQPFPRSVLIKRWFLSTHSSLPLAEALNNTHIRTYTVRF